MSDRRTYLPWFIEPFAVGLAKLLYAVRSSGTERFPKQGGVLLIANHLSYVDVAVLQLATPRPLRFLAHHGPRSPWFFRPIFKLAGVLTLRSTNPVDSIRQVVKSLQAGEVVCVFPEGHISRTGQLMGLNRGFEVMARRAGVPVVAAAHDGLWGSIFSFSGNHYLWKSPRLMPTPVFVAFGAPMTAETVDVLSAREALLDLGAQAFEERPTLRRHLAREAVRSLARRPWENVVVDRTAQRRTLNAAQLVAAATVLSRRLKATVQSRRVGIVLPPGAGAFIANLAVICAGKIPVNLNFTAGRASLEASMRQGEIDTVLSADVLKTKVPGFPWPEKTLDLKREIDAAGGKRAMLPWLLAAWLLPNPVFANLLRLPRVGDRAEAALLFTSGSAGEPKGVVLSHRNLLANCAQISSMSILPEHSKMLGCLPIFHSFGFTVTLWYPMLRSCNVVTIPSPLDTRKMLEAISEEAVTALIAAPTFIRPMLKKARPGELRSLDLLVTGAEKLPDDLYEAFLETFHLEILQGYGLTETAPVSNVNQPNPPVVTSTAEPQVAKQRGSVGRLLPGMTARIVDPETGAPLPATTTGMILFRGANVFGGYLHDETKTRAALRDGWFVTGDLGRFDEAGFLFIEGRLSRFSKIGGEMVPHGTIEHKIVEIFGWSQDEGPMIVVVGVPDPIKGESLVLLATVEVTLEDLRAKLGAAGLPNLWVPKVVKRIDKIPMLGTGKTDLRRAKEIAREA